MPVTASTRTDLELLRAGMHQECALIRKDMEILSTSLTVRTGSMLVVAVGLMFAALKLT